MRFTKVAIPVASFVVFVATSYVEGAFVSGAQHHSAACRGISLADKCVVPGEHSSMVKGSTLQLSNDENSEQAKMSSVEDTKSKVSQFGTWNPLRLAVLKLGFTELRFTSPLNYEKRSGSYNCANCGTVLFDSVGKYNSGTGWPSFWRTAEGNVSLVREWDGRMECTCENCGGHLGHVFPDGPRRSEVSALDLEPIPESDVKVGSAENSSSRLPRYCMNGASLRFEPRE
mmetsp:Transcript_13153/g.27177  ORF Transcript_13153/g.27177 Transcript_13153/m.27177 type:complete len:229 (-) Transcript_13153:463-1149(-)|eukprot:CAMPEP_0183309272 /NCGR_PEP_ID=MMETSP0160_2-20130417/24755_1 /TAXON_ID=2839 ORGANISM="Odontella Sinensis, Strain Grunow 1884" /NCGR_SAMPLE_ID=MMETSP0160_2 /ASSEMBLY_ACC=CAM_ASM_000250 /LENGTH=228 /DNA_ID=CAMNT_0025473273 /DNA_START=82 /DNA_END=768 /DNA_ORIENTATION=+